MADAAYVPKIDVSAETKRWSPQRSDLRYTFIATIEVLDPHSRKQIVSTTSKLSRYGCHVRTSTPFLQETSVRLKISNEGRVFQSHGKVVYAITAEGMGIHFADVGIGDRLVLKDWLVRLSNRELEHRLRETPKPRIKLSREEKVLAACAVGVADILAAVLAWVGVL